MEIIKYPRTQHIAGSRLQSGDEDLSQVPITDLYGKYLVLEEKVDGGSSGISFHNDNLLLQSRGHFLQGGPRETQFNLLKQWAATYSDDLYIVLGNKYIAYGEWLFKKHTVYYDALPHFWMEFDIYDKEKKAFLDTPSREKLLAGFKYNPVKVLWTGIWDKTLDFRDFLTPSHFKTQQWQSNLRLMVEQLGYSWDLIWKHTDHSNLMEGIYIKWEEDGVVRGRYKFVRHDFVSLIVSNDEHHDNLPTVPNKLADGKKLF